MGIAHSILDLIGNTPLLALERYAPKGKVLAKLEAFNPLSSAKDRAALYMIRDAEERGVLKHGGGPELYRTHPGLSGGPHHAGDHEPGAAQPALRPGG